MSLRDFLAVSAISLDLAATTRDEALAELTRLLCLGERPAAVIVRQLVRREMLGSTGFGGGIAIPHCRTMAVSRLRMAFGRHRAGLAWGAVDHQPVNAVFLIVAPPAEISNQYLPTLGRVAQLAHDPRAVQTLRQLESADDFWKLVDDRGV